MNTPPPIGTVTFPASSVGAEYAGAYVHLDVHLAALHKERERCVNLCEEVATHGRYQMEIDLINTAFWNGYAAGADQCATDILESDHAD